MAAPESDAVPQVSQPTEDAGVVPETASPADKPATAQAAGGEPEQAADEVAREGVLAEMVPTIVLDPIPQTPPHAEAAIAQATNEPEVEVLVAEVLVEGATGELEDIVYQAITVQPGQTATRSQLQEDINAVFATGFFSNVRAVPSDTPLGVRVTFIVTPNPVLRQVNVVGVQVLPEQVINAAFQEQYGKILNLRDFQDGVQQIEAWYQEQGYILAQVVDASPPTEDGVVTLEIAEGVVEDVRIRFVDEEGEDVDEEGNPIEGRTKEYVVTREMAIQEGDVFDRDIIESDLQRLFRLGLFDDVQLNLTPGQDPRRVVVVVNVAERNTGSIAAGGGVSSASGLFGTVSYQEQNLFGNAQRLGAEVQVGERGLLFDISFTDPWIKGDPYRTSYTVNAFGRRAISLIFDGGEEEVELPNGDRPRVQRFGGGVSFNRPLSRNPLESPEWRVSLGLQYERVSIRDEDGELSPEDELGNDLSFSGDGSDDLYTAQFGVVRDRRNNPLQPTQGSLLRVATEQTFPFGKGSILFNRLRASYSYYLPVRFISFADGPTTLAFNVQAGTVLGDLPPYEAFALGGSNSVRGYGEAELGAGRSFAQATVEYRFPVFRNIIGGALFVDAGTDLGTGDNVPGEPAEIRDKPGTGFGYGLGIRVQSPLGAIRIDYALNDDGDSRFHFGIGERF